MSQNRTERSVMSSDLAPPEPELGNRSSVLCLPVSPPNFPSSNFCGQIFRGGTVGRLELETAGQPTAGQSSSFSASALSDRSLLPLHHATCRPTCRATYTPFSCWRFVTCILGCNLFRLTALFLPSWIRYARVCSCKNRHNVPSYEVCASAACSSS